MAWRLLTRHKAREQGDGNTSPAAGGCLAPRVARRRCRRRQLCRPNCAHPDLRRAGNLPRPSEVCSLKDCRGLEKEWEGYRWLGAPLAQVRGPAARLVSFRQPCISICSVRLNQPGMRLWLCRPCCGAVKASLMPLNSAPWGGLLARARTSEMQHLCAGDSLPSCPAL